MLEYENKQTMIDLLKMRKKLNIPTWITSWGYSMLPLIFNGSKVWIIPPAKEVRPGTVLVFEVEGNLLIHRLVTIIKKDGKVLYQTKGDNVFYRDIMIEDVNILGIVKRIKRKESKREFFLRQNTVLSRLISIISYREHKIHVLTYDCTKYKKYFINALKYFFKMVIWLLSYIELALLIGFNRLAPEMGGVKK